MTIITQTVRSIYVCKYKESCHCHRLFFLRGLHAWASASWVMVKLINTCTIPVVKLYIDPYYAQHRQCFNRMYRMVLWGLKPLPLLSCVMSLQYDNYDRLVYTMCHILYVGLLHAKETKPWFCWWCGEIGDVKVPLWNAYYISRDQPCLVYSSKMCMVPNYSSINKALKHIHCQLYNSEIILLESLRSV